MVIYQSRK